MLWSYSLRTAVQDLCRPAWIHKIDQLDFILSSHPEIATCERMPVNLYEVSFWLLAILWPRLILFPPRSKLHPFLFKAPYLVGGLASQTSLPFIASWRSVPWNIYPNLLGIGPSSAFRTQAEQRHGGCFRNVVRCRNNRGCKLLTSHLAWTCDWIGWVACCSASTANLQ